MERQYFCCPKCGVRYRIVFDGKRYKCKKCQSPFNVPNNSPKRKTHQYPNITSSSKSKKESIWTKNKITPVWLPALVFIIAGYIVCSDCIKDNKEKKTKPKTNKTALQKKPSYTPDMYDARLKRFGEFMANYDAVIQYGYEKHDAWVQVTDSWYYTPKFQRERVAQEFFVWWVTACDQTGFSDVKRQILFVRDAYGKVLASYSGISGYSGK